LTEFGLKLAALYLAARGGLIMHKCFIAAFLTLAFCFGTANKANAQILYGYSSPADYGYGSGDLSSWYNPWGYSSSSGGGGYSPLSVYVPLYPTYPKLGVNYQKLSLATGGFSSYGTGMGGMNYGYGGMNRWYGGMPWYGGMNPWMNGMRPWGMSPLWMRR
jgi:hypothetical protein